MGSPRRPGASWLRSSFLDRVDAGEVCRLKADPSYGRLRMRSFAVFALLALFVVPSVAWPCSPASYLKRFELSDQVVLGSNPPPTPIVRVEKIDRGPGGEPGMCGDLGTIHLLVGFPDSAWVDHDAVGFEFEVLRGFLPDEIFPSGVWTSYETEPEVRLNFNWLDDPRVQRPLNFDVAIRAVNRYGARSKAQVVKIRAPVHPVARRKPSP